MARSLQYVLLSLAALVGSAVASPIEPSAPGLATLFKRALPPPGQDPFYQAPSGFASSAPGTILKSRTVPVYFNGNQIPVTAYQLLYRTNSVNDTALATVTTIFKPANAIANQLVSFATAEDSDFINCAPSYNYDQTMSTNSIVQTETLLIEGFINKGYIVASPDYQGPDSAFAAGRLEGKGVLDGIRAALNYAPLCFDKKTARVAAYGYSGGAIATGWGAALHPKYAPDINLVGVVTGGTPANLSGTLDYLETPPRLFSGFAVGGITGLLAAYSSLDTLLDKIATPAAKAAIAKARMQCAQDDISSFAGQNVLSYQYTTAGPRLLYLPEVMAITSKNILGAFKNETPSAPLYVFHAVADEIIPIANADTMVASYCKNGIKSLTYQRIIGGVEHASGEILGYPAGLAYLVDRLNGVPAPVGCSTQTVATSLFDKGALGAGLSTVLGDLLDILQTRIGLSDEILKAALSKLPGVSA